MLGAAIVKEVILLVRDRGALVSLFLLPVAFITVFGLIFDVGPDRGEPRPIAIHHAAGDPVGERIAAALTASGAFVPQLAASPEAVRARVAGEDVIAGLIVPAGAAPGARPVELSLDEAMPLQARGPVQAALTGIVARAMSGAPIAPAGSEAVFVVVETPPGIDRPLEGITSFQVTVPGNAVLFGFFIALSAAMGFTEERRSGTWRRALAAPVRRSTLLLAKLVPYALVGMVQLAFLFAIGAAAFGMEIGGSIVALVVFSAAVVACGTALGLVMASVARTEKQLGGIGSVVLLVMGMIGGCMFPRLLMPDFMQAVGLGVPHGWALDGYYALLVRDGAGLADVAPQIGALLGFTAVFAAIGVALFRFER